MQVYMGIWAVAVNIRFFFADGRAKHSGSPPLYFLSIINSFERRLPIANDNNNYNSRALCDDDGIWICLR